MVYSGPNPINMTGPILSPNNVTSCYFTLAAQIVCPCFRTTDAYAIVQYVEITSLASTDPTRPNENVLFMGARSLGNSFGGSGFWTEAEPLAFIENADTLTQALAYWNKDTKEVPRLPLGNL